MAGGGPQAKSMLKNKTMMKNYLEKENLGGMTVIKGFCMDGMHCWPIQVFAMTVFGLHIICFVVTLYISGSLYSSGLQSTKFYQGGGFILIGMALLGLAFGFAFAFFLEFNWLKACSLAGPMMTVFMSIVLIGRRGLFIGGMGGVCAGLPIGSLIGSHEIGISLGGVIGLLLGGILGVCPFFSNLDINQRYLNKQNMFGSFSEPGSFSSDGFSGYQTVIKYDSSDFR